MPCVVEEALERAMRDLDDLPVTSAKVSRTVTIEFWRGLAERATERADLVQEELDEHGESEPPEDEGSITTGEDDADDEDDGD